MTPDVFWTIFEIIPKKGGHTGPPLQPVGVDLCVDPSSDTPAWLSPGELQRLAGMRFAKRRREWLLGRQAGKYLLAASDALLATLPPQHIHILNEPDGAPFVEIEGKGRHPVSLSISHRDPLAFCAVTSMAGLHIGVDIEKVEPRPAEFAADYFTQAELTLAQRCSASERPLLDTLVWSAKESALKALRLGLRVDTRQVEVLPEEMDARDGWQPLRVSSALSAGQESCAWWQPWGEYVLTVAVLGASTAEIIQVE
jgi:4'-phosphopantetheinyl transferase